MMFWNKSSGDGDAEARGQTALEPAPSPVTEALILVCEKCGKKLTTDPALSPSREITQAMKAKIREAGGRGKIRGIVSGCLDICPKDGIAIAISRARGAESAQARGAESAQAAGDASAATGADLGGGDEFYILSGDLSAAADIILKQVMR